jgi:hypothetical protein
MDRTWDGGGSWQIWQKVWQPCVRVRHAGVQMTCRTSHSSPIQPHAGLPHLLMPVVRFVHWMLTIIGFTRVCGMAELIGDSPVAEKGKSV